MPVTGREREEEEDGGRERGENERESREIDRKREFTPFLATCLIDPISCKFCITYSNQSERRKNKATDSDSFFSARNEVHADHERHRLRSCGVLKDEKTR